MRRMLSTRIITSLVLLASGCWATTKKEIKPPPRPDEFIVPPQNDARYSAPIAFPKEAFKDEELKAKPKDVIPPGGGGPQIGGGPGTRGY